MDLRECAILLDDLGVNRSEMLNSFEQEFSKSYRSLITQGLPSGAGTEGTDP